MLDTRHLSYIIGIAIENTQYLHFKYLDARYILDSLN